MKKKRLFSLNRMLDRAVGYVAVDLDCDRSEIVASALQMYLPTISTNPVVLQALQQEVSPPSELVA